MLCLRAQRFAGKLNAVARGSMRGTAVQIIMRCCLHKSRSLLLPLLYTHSRMNLPAAHPCMSYSPSSSSNSPSSSAVASWYCWYSETKSFMLLSASVNSISSIPSPVYQ